MSDINEYIRAEELLRDEVAWRRMLVDQSRDGIVVLDEEGKVYEANIAFARMLGYSMEEMPFLYVWDWESQYSRTEILGMLESVDKSGDHFETRHRRKDGTDYEVEISTNGAEYGGKKLVFCVCRDVTERNQAHREREALIGELKRALAEIRALRGILPICSFCKKVRDDDGYWEQVDVYIQEHLQADVTHGVCPECMREHYPEIANGDEQD
ncbi:MAG: hypothetical protein A2133_04245 [Actinobacteria bacterium RBG_16_64_13]|nr:MAG: hypothetical protein A2133_04245 [Actinobacteria bacterium RBG_16_64_13]